MRKRKDVTLALGLGSV